MTGVRLKFCGLSRPEEIDAANEARPDYVGFVFAESRRRVTKETAARLRRRLNAGIIPVGVFTRRPVSEIVCLAESGAMEAVQLHGDWTDEEITRIRNRTGRPVIRAFSVRSEKDVVMAQAAAKLDAVDYLLLDGPSPGSGAAFDRRLLTGRRFSTPFFLAGGITVETLGNALAVRPFAVDLSGGIETDGLKDRMKMMTIAQKIRQTTKEKS